MSGWIGVDLDGTLAFYEHGKFRADHIGEPIPEMVNLVRKMLARGQEVRIFTARVYPINACIDASTSDTQLSIWEAEVRKQAPVLMRERITEAFVAVRAIRAWTKTHLGKQLSVTNIKDYNMVLLYDDRAKGVITNEGIIVGG